MSRRQPEGSWQVQSVTPEMLTDSWPRWAAGWTLDLPPTDNVCVEPTVDAHSGPNQDYLKVIAGLASAMKLVQVGQVAQVLDKDKLEKPLRKFIKRRRPRAHQTYKYTVDYLSLIGMYIMAKRQLGRIPPEWATYAPPDI